MSELINREPKPRLQDRTYSSSSAGPTAPWLTRRKGKEWRRKASWYWLDGDFDVELAILCPKMATKCHTNEGRTRVHQPTSHTVIWNGPPMPARDVGKSFKFVSVPVSTTVTFLSRTFEFYKSEPGSVGAISFVFRGKTIQFFKSGSDSGRDNLNDGSN
jgi:hypothetical protein